MMLFALISCKDSPKEEVNASKHLTFELSATVYYDDVFKLFYVNEGQQHITVDQMVKVEVKKSTEIQTINFTTQSQEIPTKLLLVFGNDEKRQKLIVNSCSVSLGYDKIDISRDKFFQMFIPNKYIEYDNDKATATAGVVNGDFKPSFRAREILIDRMLLEFD